MGYLLQHPFQFGPWWLWLTIALIGLVAAGELAYLHWWFTTTTKRNLRAVTVIAERRGRRTEDLYWQLREVEAANAALIWLERAVANCPERVAEMFDLPTDTTLRAVS